MNSTDEEIQQLNEAERQRVEAEQQQQDTQTAQEVAEMNFSKENGGEFVGSQEIAQRAAEAGVSVDPSMLPQQQPQPGADPSLEQKIAGATIAVGTMGPMGLMAMGINPPSPNDPSKL
ncbi:MAG: hypothetical protein ACRBDL_01405 [Alphaproteobacteria bacterium]